VVGAGFTAFDVVRIMLRLGADEAEIVYRRTRKEMPGRGEEIEHSQEEGAKIRELTNPVRFIGDENGFVKAVEVQRMELGEPDSSGRRRPVPIPGSEFEVEAELAVVAIGQSPNPLLIRQVEGLQLGRWGNVEVDPSTMATSLEGIYAGGDAVRGGATVILAMGDGRKAARAIDQWLRRC